MEVVQSSQTATVESRLAGGETSEPVFRLSLPSGFSVVVDDVDAGLQELVEPDDSSSLPQPAAQQVEQQQPKETGGERPDARIRQIQVEAESRKSEFARLLEEHAQVVRQLKQMEGEEAASTTA